MSDLDRRLGSKDQLENWLVFFLFHEPREFFKITPPRHEAKTHDREANEEILEITLRNKESEVQLDRIDQQTLTIIT